MLGGNGRSTRATSVESELGPATSQDPPSQEQTETHAHLSTYTPITEPIDRPTSASAALFQEPYMRDGGEDDRTAAVVANLSAPALHRSPSRLRLRLPRLKRSGR